MVSERALEARMRSQLSKADGATAVLNTLSWWREEFTEIRRRPPTAKEEEDVTAWLYAIAEAMGLT